MVGDPVDHSRSPDIHRAAFDELGLDWDYAAIRVDTAGLGDIVARIRRGELEGVNVTMPHKLTAATLVDDLSEDARRSGSVNTIVRRPDGTTIGHSTDITALRRMWPGDGSAPALVLGSGGAAAAAWVAAPGEPVYGSARRPGAVSESAASVGVDLVEVPWGAGVVSSVVVNATPVGMEDESLPPRVIELAGALIDMAYGLNQTPSVATARRLGLPVVDGLGLLVEQAADSFRLWSGLQPPVRVMTEAARNSSRGTLAAPNQT